MVELGITRWSESLRYCSSFGGNYAQLNFI